ncbi:MAG: hypothetical protein RL412_500 [Pseudomonadota bacterium]|jgi:hypothetical protein
MFRIVSIYVCAFILLTAADVGTTLWASSIGAGQEFNHAVATPEGLLAVERILLINGAMLLFTAGMLVWALRNADRIDPRYLARPERAVFNYFYLNPFSSKNIPKSVLHYLALPLVMLIFKAFASMNNTLIGFNVPDLVTPLAIEVQSLVGEGPAAFWVVIFILFHPMWWLALRITAFAARRGIAVEPSRPAAG